MSSVCVFFFRFVFIYNFFLGLADAPARPYWYCGWRNRFEPWQTPHLTIASSGWTCCFLLFPTLRSCSCSQRAAPVFGRASHCAACQRSLFVTPIIWRVEEPTNSAVRIVSTGGKRGVAHLESRRSNKNNTKKKKLGYHLFWTVFVGVIWYWQFFFFFTFIV